MILSIGVIIAAAIIYIKAESDKWTYWQLADPFCTYIFSIVAIYSTISIAKDSLIILLDGCDNPDLLAAIRLELDQVKHIEEYQELRVWSLNREKYCAGVKIMVSAENEEHCK